ncbi:mitochondrial ribosomal protein subunit l23 [Stemphylium lycopersici]|uniref:Large ribosomal subunit protein uL23m n=1 Tax=Stemphylium lycopersici TaxID=183478 RepID=A0A364N021_STELY|nr:mitochondrial ribosomal protein subunit l23 [Stemphylium lycopersici]
MARIKRDLALVGDDYGLAPRCPKFTVALIRTPKLSPYHARFLVPLDFSKYDLRDYLFHAYNVKCFNIRSYVKQMPVRDTREQPRHWFRAESKKYMTVEMEQPFVWPEVPDLEPWGQKEKQEEVAEATRVNGGVDSNDARNAARKLREQVRKLLYKDVARPGQASAKEVEAQEARESEERMLKRMSRIKLWERERPVKTVESDNRKNYAIKV